MDSTDREQKDKLLRDLLTYPGETTSADYKSAIGFKEKDDFSNKLVKHILGFANTGGGYLVIGFTEQAKKLTKDSNLSLIISATYESTKLGLYVNHFVKGTQKVTLTVHKIEHEGMEYPIIQISPFKRDPFFCNSTVKDKSGNTLLQEGVIYVRDPITRTVLIGSPDQWQDLIDQVVSQRQDELLTRFRTLMDDIGFSTSPKKIKITVSQQVKVDSWIKDQREELSNLLKKSNHSQGYFEASHWLESGKVWDQDQLLQAADKSQVQHTGWPIGAVIGNPEMKPYPTAQGIKAIMVSDYFDALDYWYLREDGSYFFARAYHEDASKGIKDSRILHFDIRIWRIAEMIDHCISLYKSLGVDPKTIVHLMIRHTDLMNRKLGTSDFRRILHFIRESKVEESIWDVTVTLDELFVGRNDFIRQATFKLFTLFDFFKPDESVISSILSEYEKSSF